MASAHHWLACSMLPAWVAAILSSTNSAAASQRKGGAVVAAGGSAGKLVGVRIAGCCDCRGGPICAGLACLVIIKDGGGSGCADARDAQRHDGEQGVERAHAARRL